MFTPYHAGEPGDWDEFLDFCGVWLLDSGDPGYDDAFDVVDDNVIDLKDFAVLAASWDLPSSEESDWYYLHDALGSVVGVVGARFGRESDRQFILYDAYGQPDTLPANGNPYLFTGRRYDRVDDDQILYYLRARHYSPLTGRFLQTDPLGYADSMNLYEYVLSNPANYLDPYGLQSLFEEQFSWWERFRYEHDWTGGILGLSPQQAQRMDKYWSQYCRAVETGQHVCHNKTPTAKAVVVTCWGERDEIGIAMNAGYSIWVHTFTFGLAHEDHYDWARIYLDKEAFRASEVCSYVSTAAADAALLVAAWQALVAAGTADQLSGGQCSQGAWSNLASAGRGVQQFFYDPRPFQNVISRQYWAAHGPANGRSLHHWLFPQRASWVPQGIRNAGFNLIELPAFPGLFHQTLPLNQWMGFAQNWGPEAARNAWIVENSIRVGVPALSATAAGAGYYGGCQLRDIIYVQHEGAE